MDTFNLQATIAVDTEGYTSELKTASEETEKTGKKLSSSLGTAGKVLAGTFATLTTASAGAVAGITSLSANSASAMDVIDKQSQKMGISTTAYQEWAHAMELSGMDISTLKTGMKTLQNAMFDYSDETKDTTVMLKELGVSVKDDLTGEFRSAEEVFNDVITVLADMGEGADRTAYATTLLGRAGTDLAPLLNSGSGAISDMKNEAHELGLVFDEETVKSGAHLNDTMTNLKNSFGAVKTGLGTALMPVIEKFSQILMKFLPKVQQIFEKIAPILEKMFDKLMPVLEEIVDAIMPVLESVFEALAPIFEEICETILPIFADLLGKLMPILQTLFEHLAPIIQAVLEAVKPILDAIWPIVEVILDLVVQLLDPLLELLEVLLKPISALLSPIASLLQPLVPLLQLIGDVLSPILELLNAILKPILEFVGWIFGGIADGLKDVTGALTGDEGLENGLSETSGYLTGDFKDAMEGLGTICDSAKTVLGSVFHGIVEFIKDPKQALSDFFSWIEDRVAGVKSLLDSLKDIEEANERTEAARGNMKAYQQRVLDAGGPTADALRKQMVEAGYEGWTLTTTKVPGLATGAVLRPNNPFLAVVGDQTSGVNVEAPLTTITDALSLALQKEPKLKKLDAQPVVVSVRLEGELEGLFRALQDRDANAVLATGRESWSY